MGKPPAFQMYASDFLVDTNDWTVDEVGIYLRLLLSEWVNGPLPNDEIRLARISGCDKRKFAKKWCKNGSVIASKFETNGSGFLINKRLELEREKQTNYRELQSFKGKMGGRPLKSRGFSAALTERKPEESSSSSSSSSSSKDKESISHSEVKIFLDFYKEKFNKSFQTDPQIEWGKDSTITKKLLKTISLEELKSLLEAFFFSEDKFIQQSGYTIGIFKTQINKLKIGVPTKHSGLKRWANEIREEEKEYGRER